jgi:RNA polymerase sigma-32 factor
MHWIKAEMHEYILRNWRMVKIATTKGQRKLFFNLRSHKTAAHSLTPAEAEAMAQELGVKREEVLEMEARFSGQDIALDPVGDDGEEAYGPLAYLTNSEDEPAQILVQAESEQRANSGLLSALNSLDARSRHIVEARWLQEDDSATLHELAAQYNISAERVRQIEQKAFQKMKVALS